MSSPRVVIGEADVITAADLAATLHSFGLEVCASVRSADEVVAAAARWRPDLVLMDLVLEGELDGAVAGARIHEELAIPVVYLTAQGDARHLQLARRSRPYGYVLKPFSDLALRATVEMALDMSRQEAARRRAEWELKKNAAALRGILDATFESVLLLDPEGAILECNQAACRVLQRELPELMGVNVFELLPPELASSRRRKVDEVAATGVPARFEDRRGRRVIDQTVLPVFDDDGRVGRLAVFARDVTSERMVTVRLAESESRYRTLVESVQSAIFILRDGRFAFVNSAAVRLFGAKGRDELLSRPALDFFAPEHHDDLHSRMADAVAGRVNPPMELTLLREDGRRLIVETVSAPVQLDGRSAVLVVGQDVSDRHRAEEALRRSEERFRTVADFTYDWEYWLGADGALFYISPSCERITGYPTEDFVKRPGLLEEIVVAEDRARFVSLLDPAAPAPRPVTAEFRIRRFDGELRWIGHASQPVFAEDGRFQGTRASNRDITDRKLAEERLRDSEEFHRQTLQAISEGVLLIDDGGRVVFSSGNLEGALGCDSDHGAIRDMIAMILERMPVEAGTGRMVAEPWEERLLLDEGGEHERTLRVDVRPVSIRGGRWLITCRDVTSRAKMEQLIRRSASDWQLTFDSMDQAVLLFDQRASLVRLNESARQLAGLPFAELLGRSVDRLPPGEPWQTLAAAVHGALSGELPAVRRTPYLQSAPCWEVSARPLPAVQEGDGVVCTVRDLSAHLRLQERLHRSELMSTLGSVVAGVAHEVRNPLFSISATVDALEACHADLQELQPFFKGLRLQVGRLHALMAELLDFGRPPRQEAVECRVGTLLGEARDVAAPLFRDRQLRLALGDCAELPPLRAHAESVVTAVRNLLANAAEHAPAGSVVTLDAHQESSRLVIAVHDQGPGFAEDALPRVFDPFFSSRRGGTGLGLAIVQRVAELHDGSAIAYNHPTGGAVVELRIPCPAAREALE